MEVKENASYIRRHGGTEPKAHLRTASKTLIGARRRTMTQQQAEFFDLYRAGLRTAADLMKASLESAERLQNQQLVAIRTAIDQQVKSADELARARTIDELMAFQTRLAGDQFERAM